MPLPDTLPLPSSNSSSQQPLPHPSRSISSLSIHKPQAQALKVGFGICTTTSEGPGQISLTCPHVPPPSLCWELETRAEGSGHLPQLPTFRPVPPLPSHAQPDLVAIPLFKGKFSSPFFFLLQPPASFFQLGERVGCWIGWHSRILDEGVRRLDSVPELGTDPRMHCNRSLNGEGSDHIMGQLLLST